MFLTIMVNGKISPKYSFFQWKKNDLSEEIPYNENPNLPQHHSGFISCIYTSKRIISGISVGRAANVCVCVCASND